MTTKPLIMIVDDELINCKLLEQVLAPKYQTISCKSGEECLAQLDNHQPEIILLDVMMPGLNGYEVCSRIKDNEETAHIPVFFISALDTLDDRLNGYNAGGDDYLGKPIDLSILLKKIELKLINKATRQQLVKDVEKMQSGYMSALNMGEEFGQVTHFIEQCLLAHNYENLLYVFFDSMRYFDLNTAAQIRYDSDELTLNTEGDSLPLEKELLLKAQFDGRILEFGSRMFVSYSYFSLLIKNWPTDDHDRKERLKEHITAIAKACNHRVKSIGTELNLQSHKDITTLFKETSLSFEQLNKKLEAHSRNAISLSQNIGEKLTHNLILPELKEPEKNKLLKVINNATQECTELNNELNNELNQLMKEHNSINKTLHKIIEQINK